MLKGDIDAKPDNFSDDAAGERKIKALRNTMTISFSSGVEIKIPA